MAKDYSVTPRLRVDTVAPDSKVKTEASDVDGLLDAGDGAVVTVVAGDTRLAAHAAVLSARSPVFRAMFQHDTLEAGSGVAAIQDVEGAVLRQLVAHCYTLEEPPLPGAALRLLVAADKYGLLGLKAGCELRAAASLSVDNVAEAAVLAVRHSCTSLTAAVFAFIKDHFLDVMGSQGWADMMRNHTEGLVEVSQLLSKQATETRTNTIASDTKIETKATDLGTLLDAGDGAVVTLVAGDTQLAVHTAVLSARSNIFKAMFDHDTPEGSGGQVTISDVEGPVLRQLVSYCYTLWAPKLPCMAPQLLAAADRYGMSTLKSWCEQQVVADLSVGNVAAAAVLAISHSCTGLTEAAVTFIKAHILLVVGTEGWADAMRNQPEYLTEVSRLLAEPPPEIRNLSGEEKGRRLIQAANEGSLEQLWMLMAAGADVGARDEKMLTALHFAALYGHLNVLRCLLEGGAAVDETASGQYSPLHCAAYNGHVAVVKFLVASSADPNCRSIDQKTPLHLAAQCGYTETVATLLEAGADRVAKDGDGKSPLDLATEEKHQEVIKLLT